MGSVGRLDRRGDRITGHVCADARFQNGFGGNVACVAGGEGFHPEGFGLIREQLILVRDFEAPGQKILACCRKYGLEQPRVGVAMLAVL